MGELTAKQLESILDVVGSETNRPFNESRRLLGDAQKKEAIFKMRGAEAGERHLAALGQEKPTNKEDSGQKDVNDAADSARKESALDGSWEVIKELMKTHTFLAVALIVLVVVASIGIGASGFPMIGALVFVVAMLVFIALALTAVYEFLRKKKVHGIVDACCVAMDRAEGDGNGKCKVSPGHGAKLSWGHFVVWLTCQEGLVEMKYLVDFDWHVVPVFAGKSSRRMSRATG